MIVARRLTQTPTAAFLLEIVEVGMAEAGLLQYEHADDTSADFESYDAVAADRAATPSSAS